MSLPVARLRTAALAVALVFPAVLSAQGPARPGEGAGGKARKPRGGAALTFPPALPGGREVVTDTSDEFLKGPATLRKGVAVAKAAPTIDFMYFPGQNYPGKPWSNWGDGSFANNCLLARRLVEKGVRFVQLFDWGWDVHGTVEGDDIIHQLPRKCQQTDRPGAGFS